MKLKYLLILYLFFYNFAIAQVPGTPRLIGKSALSQTYTLDLLISGDLNSGTVTGFALNNGQSPVTTCGLIWGTNALFDVNNSGSYIGITTNGDVTGANSFSATITNLLSQTSTIFIAAYATNSFGTFYSRARTLPKQTVVTGTGKTWMAYNLGASGMPASVDDTTGYGFLFQWGRKADGHMIVRPTPSGTIVTQSNDPTHGLFILGGTGGNSYYDWRIARDQNLWKGTNGGVNNPCPTGFRVPTSAEFTAETDRITPKTGAGGFASSLALTYGGRRASNQFTAFTGGVIYTQGSIGTYWTSDADGPPTTSTASFITFKFDGFEVNKSVRSEGRSVRCIKD